MPNGIKIPFGSALNAKRTSRNLSLKPLYGLFELTSDSIELAESKIIMVVLSNNGEIAMNYDFGANLNSLLFEYQKNDELKQLISDRVSDAINKYVPEVSLELINVNFSDTMQYLNNNQVHLTIRYSLVNFKNLSKTLDIVV